MFGMALKFLELGLEPLNVLKNSDASNRQVSDSNNQEHTGKKPSKSSQDIKATKFARPSSIEFQNSDPYGQKENLPSEKLKASQIISSHISEDDLEELKQSQKRILQDLKKSISKSLSSSQISSESREKESKSNFTYAQSKQIYEKVGDLVLSKIEQLSEEYLEYSMRKEEFANQSSRLKAQSSILENSNKTVSCDLIKSIVKSVLLDENDQKDVSESFPSAKVSDSVKRMSKQNFQTYESSGKSLEMNGTVTEFIKDLFASLNLINENQMQANSLKQLTQSAKKNFKQLKGNDYVEKLHQMLQSVENIDQQASKLKLSNSLKVSYLYNPNLQPDNQTTPDKVAEDKQSRSRKEILIKKEEDKKVKLVSPETFSELETRRNTIENQISSAVELLTKTRRVRKFDFHSKSVSQVYLNFSMDFKFMSYKQVQSNFFTHSNFNKIVKQFCSCTKGEFSESDGKEEEKMTMLSLPWNLVNVSKGIKTKNFIKYEELFANDEKKGNEQGLHEERCLSLLFKNRTYDFELQSREVRDEYFRAIKIMIKSSFDL